MNEQLKELAEQAGLITRQDIDENNQEYFDDLECFAELVQINEREACAKLCEKTWKQQALRHYAPITYSQAANSCAAAIRARGNHEQD
jgi:hypothetical protein